MQTSRTKHFTLPFVFNTSEWTKQSTDCLIDIIEKDNISLYQHKACNPDDFAHFFCCYELKNKRQLRIRKKNSRQMWTCELGRERGKQRSCQSVKMSHSWQSQIMCKRERALLTTVAALTHAFDGWRYSTFSHVLWMRLSVKNSLCKKFKKWKWGKP